MAPGLSGSTASRSVTCSRRASYKAVYQNAYRVRGGLQSCPTAIWRRYIPACPSDPWSVVQDGRPAVVFLLHAGSRPGRAPFHTSSRTGCWEPSRHLSLSTHDRRRGSGLHFALALSQKNKRNEDDNHDDNQENRNPQPVIQPS